MFCPQQFIIFKFGTNRGGRVKYPHKKKQKKKTTQKPLCNFVLALWRFWKIKFRLLEFAHEALFLQLCNPNKSVHHLWGSPYRSFIYSCLGKTPHLFGVHTSPPLSATMGISPHNCQNTTGQRLPQKCFPLSLDSFLRWSRSFTPPLDRHTHCTLGAQRRRRNEVNFLKESSCGAAGATDLNLSNWAVCMSS